MAKPPELYHIPIGPLGIVFLNLSSVLDFYEILTPMLYYVINTLPTMIFCWIAINLCS
jgi:hypothetical protein